MSENTNMENMQVHQVGGTVKIENCLEGNQTSASPTLTQPTIQESNSQPIKIRLIAFKCEKDGDMRSVEVDKPVIEYAKKYTVSENINLYSQKMKATINPYVPCCALGEGENIQIIKRQFKDKATILSLLSNPNYDVSKEGTFFKVSCSGTTKRNAPKIILSDPKHDWDGNNLAVYGQMDQTIKQAIQNDDRFNITSDFRLKTADESQPYHTDVPLSSLNPDVVYTVLIKSVKPESKPNIKTKPPKPKGLQSSDEAKDFKNAGEIKPVPQTSLDPQSEPGRQKFKLPKNYQTLTSSNFSYDFEVLSKAYGEREWRFGIISGLMKYKKPMQADTFKRLTQQLESVALIKYQHGSGLRGGTFFLLTDRLGLTCCHVLKEYFGSNPDCRPNISVIFNYDNESDKTEEYTADVAFCNQEFDFAFLRISTSLSNKGLLQHVAPPPQNGAVSIIGHPNGGSKKIDPYCSVINYSKRAEEIAANILYDRSYLHVLTEQNLMLMSEPELVTYDTCLYWGASGSPVFNDQGDLVAIHTGGYPVRTDLPKVSIIEYGRNIIDILMCGSQLEEILSWFTQLTTQDNSLATYVKTYQKPGEHSVKMQPVIRKFLEHIGKKNESPQGQNPDLDDSGSAESPMDTD